MDISVQGADDLAKLGKRLKQLGDKGLRKELYRGLNRAAKPVKKAGRDAARRQLPQRGGLALKISKTRMTSRTRAVGRNAGVRIVAAGGLDMNALDRGRLKHPVWGHRDRWVLQDIRAHVLTNGFASAAPEARRQMLVVLDDVARRAEKGHS